ncbi:MAG: hypothetical protein ACRD9Q_02440, partial [Nitrososphaeraceae archaeon]
MLEKQDPKNPWREKMKYNFPNEHQLKNAKRLGISFLIITSLFTIVMPMASATHNGTVNLDAGGYTYDSGALITVSDPTAEGAGTVTVTVTSDIDPVGISLVLTETLPGLFDNFDPGSGTGTLLFMDGDNKFPLETTKTISFNDLTSPLPEIQMSSVLVVTSEGFVAILDLSETEDNSNTYEGTIKFTASPIDPTDIPITAGETFRISFPCGGGSNGQITPVPVGSTLG